MQHQRPIQDREHKKYGQPITEAQQHSNMDVKIIMTSSSCTMPPPPALPRSHCEK